MDESFSMTSLSLFDRAVVRFDFFDFEFLVRLIEEAIDVDLDDGCLLAATGGVKQRFETLDESRDCARECCRETDDEIRKTMFNPGSIRK